MQKHSPETMMNQIDPSIPHEHLVEVILLWDTIVMRYLQRATSSHIRSETAYMTQHDADRIVKQHLKRDTSAD